MALRIELIAMTEIAAVAGASVGGVYARFESKNALLYALHARYEAYRTEYLTQAFAPELWRDADLETCLRGVVSAIVNFDARAPARAAYVLAALLVASQRSRRSVRRTTRRTLPSCRRNRRSCNRVSHAKQVSESDSFPATEEPGSYRCAVRD